MSATYIGAFISALVLSLLLTPLVRWLAIRFKAVDQPDRRKRHAVAVPRVGGVAITLAWLLPFLYYLDLNRQFWALLGAVGLLFAVGLYDDLKSLNAKTKLIWQILAAGVALAGGIGIIYVTNPLGGDVINLGSWNIPISLGPLAFDIRPIANFVSILWIVGIINTVNFLDGLDGLAAGVSSIAAIVLFILAITPALNNPTVAILALILLGALIGFLPYNSFPSTIFMGDSGAYVVGAILALLSIYVNARIAVAVLVLGIAIIDAILTVLRRLIRKQSPFRPDRQHLHHRLLDSGMLTHRQVVVMLYVFSALIALALLVGNAAYAFLVLALLMIATISVIRIFGSPRVIED